LWNARHFYGWGKQNWLSLSFFVSIVAIQSYLKRLCTWQLFECPSTARQALRAKLRIMKRYIAIIMVLLRFDRALQKFDESLLFIVGIMRVI
jgi:hypothetical protein